MRTADNRLMVWAITLEAALHSHDLPTVVKHVAEDLRILAAADELEQLAGEGPSDGEMLEWVCENVTQCDKVGDFYRMLWIDERFNSHVAIGKHWREAITSAMRAAASEQGSEVNT